MSCEKRKKYLHFRACQGATLYAHGGQVGGRDIKEGLVEKKSDWKKVEENDRHNEKNKERIFEMQ